VKLNIGCGTDYRQGFINIDGSRHVRSDKIIDFTRESLLSHFDKNSVDLILANDIIEHLYRWEAEQMIREFFDLLREEGRVQIKVPDGEHILNNKSYSVDKKLFLLFGGQDRPQGVMDSSRQEFPQFFCHKYGWTQKAMKLLLEVVGFKNVETRNIGNNFVVGATRCSAI